MDDILDKYDLPKLNQNQISKLNRHITVEEMETVIKSLPPKTKQKTAQDQMVLAQNSTRYSKKNYYQYSSNRSTQ